ncbi:unnamed protein product, partial [Pocillopora meandrina]
DDSIEELIASVSGLSSNDNTPQKPRLPAVKRPKEDAQRSPAKQKLFDEEYVIILLLIMEYKKLISYKRQGSKNREIPSRSLQVHMKINVSFVVWEGDSDSNGDISVLRKGRRLYANQDEIDKLKPVQVKKVPLAPQGPVKYEVQYNDADPLSVVVDNWKWGRAQPCKRAGFCKGGRRTLQLCLGSLECANKKCAYLKIHKSPNKVDFNRSKRCVHCHSEAIKKHCSARKYVENDRCHKKMTVIYLQEHDCSPKQEEDKPSKEEVENILRIKPTKSAGQLQLDVVREALLSGKEVDEYIQSTINKKKRPGGSEIEAVQLLKDDFLARKLDENLIMCVGDDYVILSSEHKVRLGALITLGIVDEPVSLDGCESRAQHYTEIEMTTYDPILRRNVKLVSMFAAKPGENSDNVKKMVQSFDAAVNNVLPKVAGQYNVDNEDVLGRGLDPKSYVGDEGGALWRDFFHFKQDINRNSVYFGDQKSKKEFKSIMMDAYNSPTSLQAVDAEKKTCKTY